MESQLSPWALFLISTPLVCPMIWFLLKSLNWITIGILQGHMVCQHMHTTEELNDSPYHIQWDQGFSWISPIHEYDFLSNGSKKKRKKKESGRPRKSVRYSCLLVDPSGNIEGASNPVKLGKYTASWRLRYFLHVHVCAQSVGLYLSMKHKHLH